MIKRKEIFGGGGAGILILITYTVRLPLSFTACCEKKKKKKGTAKARKRMNDFFCCYVGVITYSAEKNFFFLLTIWCLWILRGRWVTIRFPSHRCILIQKEETLQLGDVLVTYLIMSWQGFPLRNSFLFCWNREVHRETLWLLGGSLVFWLGVSTGVRLITAR